MYIHLISTLDKLLEKNKHIAFLISIIILCYLAFEIYKTKLILTEHNTFINHIRSIAIIQEANKIVSKENSINSINIFIVSEYCDVVDKKGLLTSSCNIIFNYINSISKK